MKKRRGIEPVTKPFEEKKRRLSEQTDIGHLSKELYRKGRIAANELVDASSAEVSSSSSSQASGLAAHVSKGARPNKNAARDVQRAFDVGVDLPEVYMSSIEFWDKAKV